MSAESRTQTIIIMVQLHPSCCLLPSTTNAQTSIVSSYLRPQPILSFFICLKSNPPNSWGVAAVAVSGSTIYHLMLPTLGTRYGVTLKVVVVATTSSTSWVVINRSSRQHCGVGSKNQQVHSYSSLLSRFSRFSRRAPSASVVLASTTSTRPTILSSILDHSTSISVSLSQQEAPGMTYNLRPPGTCSHPIPEYLLLPHNHDASSRIVCYTLLEVSTSIRAAHHLLCTMIAR